MDNIYTKYHEAMHVLTSGKRQEVSTYKDHAAVDEFMWGFDKHPLYVLDGTLADNMKSGDLVKTIEALHTASVLRLPFPSVAIEIWADKPDGRVFILAEDNGFAKFRFGFVQWTKTDKDMQLSLLCLGDAVWHSKIPKAPANAANPHFFEVPQDVDWNDPNGEAGFEIKYSTGHPKTDMSPTLHECLQNVVTAVMLTICMININGVERKLVDPVKLNKSREKSGKHKIATHTVVRLGHVYDRSGNRVAYGPSAGGSRNPMRVHMRAAHTRRQPHGPDFLDSEEGQRYKGLASTTDTHHIVLIDAVLVNYKDGTDLAKPLPKVVKF